MIIKQIKNYFLSLFSSACNHKFIIKKIFAFTLAEAILTMTILGIIAATMITTLKPSQYKDQAYSTMKKKLYADIDRVLVTILEECTADMSLAAIYENCNRSAGVIPVSTSSKDQHAVLFNRYMKGTLYPAGVDRDECDGTRKWNPALKLKNGACIYFFGHAIEIDVNGDEGPNDDGMDRALILLSYAKGEPLSGDMDSDMLGTSFDVCSGTVTCKCSIDGAIQDATPDYKTIVSCGEKCTLMNGYMTNYSCD